MLQQYTLTALHRSSLTFDRAVHVSSKWQAARRALWSHQVRGFSSYRRVIVRLGAVISKSGHSSRQPGWISFIVAVDTQSAP